MVEENEILIEKFVDYEKAFAEFFRELTLKPAQIALVRAFLIVSKGQNEFEASKYDLVKILHKTNGEYPKNLIGNVGYAIKALQKWQQENK